MGRCDYQLCLARRPDSSYRPLAAWRQPILKGRGQNMKFTVRRAQAGDAAAIAVCLAALGYATPSALVAEKLSAFSGTSDTVLVAEDPITGIIGVVSVHLVPLFHAAGNPARLTALAVVPGHQRKGVGRALVAAAEAFAWQRDCRRVEVTSGDHREEAHMS